MDNLLILLLPISASALGVYLAVAKKRRAFLTILASNLGASVLFGLFISIKVLCCSTDPAWWLMPLFLAPLAYWAKFGIPICVLGALTSFLLKKRAEQPPISK